MVCLYGIDDTIPFSAGDFLEVIQTENIQNCSSRSRIKYRSKTCFFCKRRVLPFICNLEIASAIPAMQRQKAVGYLLTL